MNEATSSQGYGPAHVKREVRMFALFAGSAPSIVASLCLAPFYSSQPYTISSLWVSKGLANCLTG